MGTLRWAPGTLGALLGAGLACGLASWNHSWSYFLVLLGLWFLGIPMCGSVAQRMKSADPPCVIWDEIVTVPFVYLGVPSGKPWAWSILVLGFLLHRVFDIWKPPPIRHLERLPGGWGIMADDLGAALYAGIALYAVQHFL